MCFGKKKKSGGSSNNGLTAAQMVASYDNAAATRMANLEALLRRGRSGTAANVLTSPTGIPSLVQRPSPNLTAASSSRPYLATRPVRDPGMKPAAGTLAGGAA